MQEHRSDALYGAHRAGFAYWKLSTTTRLSIEVLHLIQLAVAVDQVRAGGEAELLPEGVAGGVRKTKLRRE